MYKDYLKIYLNVKLQIIEILEENTREYLCDLGFGKDFLDITPKALTLEERNE